MSRLPLLRLFSRAWRRRDVEYPVIVDQLCRAGGAGVPAGLLPGSHSDRRCQYTTVRLGVSPVDTDTGSSSSILDLGGSRTSAMCQSYTCQTPRAYHTFHPPRGQTLKREYMNVPIHRDAVTVLPLTLGLPPAPAGSTRGMAGHSKWANIRHTKGIKDAQKSGIAQKMAHKLRLAIREGGGTDPKFNYHLARVIAQASAVDVPKSTIDASLKNIEKSSTEGAQITFEAKGPGNCCIIIEAFTDNHKRTKKEIFTLFKKLGGQLGDRIGFASHAFDYKGVIHITPGGSIGNLEEAEEAAINAEAEEVEDILTEDGRNVFQIVCDPKEVYTVRKQLTEQAPDVNMDMCSFVYFPNMYSVLSDEMLEVAGKLLDNLEGLPDVMHVWSNIKAEGED